MYVFMILIFKVNTGKLNKGNNEIEKKYVRSFESLSNLKLLELSSK